VQSIDRTFGRSPLSWTTSPAVAKVLIDSGANINAVDFLRHSALHRAVLSSASEDLVNVLLAKNIDTSLEDITGFTALDWGKTSNNPLTPLLQKVTHVKKQQVKPSQKKSEKGENKEKGKAAGGKGSSGPVSAHAYTISEEIAIAIARGIPKTAEKIRFIAIDYNWGPPVSGRHDKDFLQIWAIARTASQPKQVSLLGAYMGEKNWNVLIKFEHVKKVDEDYDLYVLRLDHRLPLEFVLKLECKDGSVHYDNNGGYGINYKLFPFQGRYTSAHAGSDHIQIYPSFVRCQIIPKQ